VGQNIDRSFSDKLLCPLFLKEVHILEEFKKQDALRAIPPVNEILDHPIVKSLIECFGVVFVTESMKMIIDEYRRHIIEWQNPWQLQLKTREEIAEYIAMKLEDTIKKVEKSSLKRVINATGIVLHTNLGRAPLPQKAIESMNEVGAGYCNLEFDIGSGSRGSRYSHIESIVSRVTGAESAIIVNNNAAAVFLCLNTLANCREVVISRGQQVEIGGSFRIPDIITQSGAKMIEVGTTNKTRITDYSNVVTAETSVLLKVHTSNYKVTGFTEEVSIQKLVDLGREKGLIVIEDLGSGCLYDLSMIGLPYEPTVQDSIKYGADIVTFSGDKLLGGPQAGIIAGKKDLIDKIKKNPLARMVRCDKTTIAAMVAVLSLYMDSNKIVDNIAVLKMLALSENELSENALELETLINTVLSNKYKTEIVDELDEVGGGSLPGVILKGKAVALIAPEWNVNEIQAQLRQAKTPIICRINKDRILFNVRTLEKKDYWVVVEALVRVLE
jgi:L-seryl-tRNA(Ser) seleniumtransferase